MATPVRRSRLSGTQLLTRILDQPRLVAAVRALPPTTLASLIEHVGLEDAGELIALASASQLREVLDEDLWIASGVEDHFDPDRFSLWLEVMFESGDAAVAARLASLSEELLTLAVQRMAWVLNMDALAAGGLEDSDAALSDKILESAAHEQWEEFLLVARLADGWDVLWNALCSLDRDHHDLLRRILERCAFATQSRLEESDGLHTLLSEEELLASDAHEQRDERRAARGYVSTADARAFLRLADAPLDETERDPITRAYFRRLAPSVVAASSPAAGASAAAAGDDHAVDGPPSLLRLLGEAGVLPSVDEPEDEPAARLASGVSGDTPADLRAQMAELLRVDPALHVERMEELSYVANVLLAASRPTRPLRPVEALQWATRVCERALDGGPAHLLRQLPAEKLFLRGLRALRLEGDDAIEALMQGAMGKRDRDGDPSFGE